SLVSLIQWQASHRHLHSFPTRRSSDLADQPSATSYRDRGDSPTRPGAHPYPATMRDESAFLTTQTDKKKPFSQSFRRNNMIPVIDRKSTRLNSSHVKISYAVFCLKKKK